jgi:hypothetical protein
MAARAALVSLIATDPQMNMLGIQTSDVFGGNATDSPPRNKMFVVCRWEEVSKSAMQSNYLASVWFHVPQEMERDYGKIDIAVTRMKELMRTVEHRNGSDGWSLVAASWITDSADQYDDGYNSLNRYTQFRCACRNIA